MGITGGRVKIPWNYKCICVLGRGGVYAEKKSGFLGESTDFKVENFHKFQGVHKMDFQYGGGCTIYF